VFYQASQQSRAIAALLLTGMIFNYRVTLSRTAGSIRMQAIPGPGVLTGNKSNPGPDWKMVRLVTVVAQMYFGFHLLNMPGTSRFVS
jgi:hypothetical protein